MNGVLRAWRASLTADLQSKGTPIFKVQRAFTWPLSRIYAFFTAVRNLAYDLHLLSIKKLPGTTIAVGNIVMGGTGKSPIVMQVVRELEAKGAGCAILTRGYGSSLKAHDSMVLLNGEVLLPPRFKASLPDEAHMQSVALRDVPVVIGRQRWEAAQR